ncbi:MAG: type II secretion system protein [Planctomycetota bacterium]|nr:MAG: type II secretion system protein [Planctomycetota bacterium]
MILPAIGRKPACRRSRRKRGYSMLEVMIAVIVISLVGTSAVMALRMSLRTLNGSRTSAMAGTVIREIREYTLPLNLEELDALNGASWSPPIMGDGQALPGAANMSLNLSVTPVDEEDLITQVDPDESNTRRLRAVVFAYQRMILDVQWVVSET